MAGSWEKREKGVYRLTVDMGTDYKGKRLRKRKTVHCTSDRQADKKLSEFWSECQGNKVRYDGKITLSALADKFLDVCIAKKSTQSSYISIIRISITPGIGKQAIDKITPLHIQEWVKDLEKSGLSGKTVQCRFALLKAIFNSAVEWKMLNESPCKNIKLPPVTKPEADFYNQTEVAVIIERLLKLDDADYLALKTAIIIDLFSGLRKGELYGLEWSKVNFDTGEIKIDSTRLYAPKFKTYKDTPKSVSGNRSVTVPDFCIVLLQKLKVQQGARKLLIGEKWGPSEGLIILNPHTGRPLGSNTIYKWFVAFLEEEKIRVAKRTIHALRHTNVSMIHSLNQNLSEISKWIGHSKTSTTLNIYTHLFNDNSKKDISDKLQETFAPMMPPKENTNA